MKIRCVPRMTGNDLDFIHFTTPSFTREGVSHDQYIDKRTLEMGCSCEQATYRKLKGHLIDSEPVGCKHVIAVLEAYAQLIKELKENPND